MEAVDKWGKLEEIVRRVFREELASLGRQVVSEELEKQLSLFGKKTKLGFENGRWTGVTEEQMTAWKAAYGAVDIEGELKKAAAWIVSNPHLAPKSQHGRFLNTWLARQQNQSSLRSIPSGKSVEPGPGKKLCAYCDQVATGLVNAIWHCRTHALDAMDEKPRPHMRGVQAKAVAGE
jgi:hypothetical protein